MAQNERRRERDATTSTESVQKTERLRNIPHVSQVIMGLTKSQQFIVLVMEMTHPTTCPGL